MFERSMEASVAGAEGRGGEGEGGGGRFSTTATGTSLVVQWLRICLSVLMNLFAGQQWRCRHRQQIYRHEVVEWGRWERGEESRDTHRLLYVK